jgi:hypothetical protein
MSEYAKFSPSTLLLIEQVVRLGKGLIKALEALAREQREREEREAQRPTRT